MACLCASRNGVPPAQGEEMVVQELGEGLELCLLGERVWGDATVEKRGGTCTGAGRAGGHAATGTEVVQVWRWGGSPEHCWLLSETQSKPIG